MALSFDNIITLVSCATSLLAVCISAYAVWESKQTQLNAAYFSEMTAAYSKYLDSISMFVLRRDVASRDSLAADLYKLKLFAPEKIMKASQELYNDLLLWSDQEHDIGFPLDDRVHDLAELMKAHLETFHRRTASR